MTRRLSDELIEQMYDRLFQGPPVYGSGPVTDEQLEEAEQMFAGPSGPYAGERGKGRYSVHQREQDLKEQKEKEHAPVTDADIEEAYQSMFV